MKPVLRFDDCGLDWGYRFGGCEDEVLYATDDRYRDNGDQIRNAAS
jgi:hypothetical protein